MENEKTDAPKNETTYVSTTKLRRAFKKRDTHVADLEVRLRKLEGGAKRPLDLSDVVPF